MPIKNIIVKSVADKRVGQTGKQYGNSREERTGEDGASGCINWGKSL